MSQRKLDTLQEHDTFREKHVSSLETQDTFSEKLNGFREKHDVPRECRETSQEIVLRERFCSWLNLFCLNHFADPTPVFRPLGELFQ